MQKRINRRTAKISIFALSLCLAACSGGSGTGDSPVTTPPPSPAPAPTPAPAPSPSPSPQPTGNTPNTFTFEKVINAYPQTIVYSQSEPITGMANGTAISIIGGEYAINDSPFRSTPATINNGQQVTIKITTENASAKTTTASLSIGSITQEFSATTANLARRIEAEDNVIPGRGSSITVDNASRSAVASIQAELDTVSFIAPIDADRLEIFYQAGGADSMEVRKNGSPVGDLTIEPIFGYNARSGLNFPISTGDVIEIVADTENENRNTWIDYIDLPLSPPFKFTASPYSNIQSPNDGFSIATDGSVYSSGSSTGTLIRVSPNGDKKTIHTFTSANGASFDSLGNLFVAAYEEDAVFKISPDGVVSEFASNLDGPASIWIDTSDNLYVSAYGANLSGTGSTVYRITPDGIVSTYASGSGLEDVIGIVGDENGEIYAANNSSGQIHRITDGNVALLATANSGVNHVCYNAGYIYIPLEQQNVLQRFSIENNAVEDFMGTSYQISMDGSFDTADFNSPNDCEFDTNGRLYVSERETGNIRALYPEGEFDESLNVGAQVRGFIIHFPTDYDPTEETPAVIVFHGGGSNKEVMANITDMRRTADENNFIAVFPNGSQFSGVNSFVWNTQLGSNSNDIRFASEIIDFIIENFNVDRQRVYATGYSNGGMMAFSAACDLSDKIAAISSVGGAAQGNANLSCNPSHAVPIQQIHGTADRSVSYSSGGGNGVVRNSEIFAEKYGCDGGLSSSPLPDLNSDDSSSVIHHIQTGCPNNAQVEYYEIVNGGHTWPGALGAPDSFGAVNRDINANNVMWSFFKQFSLPE